MGMDRERHGLGLRLPLRRVEFHILLSLAAGERHGYGIIQDIEAHGETAVPDVGVPAPAAAVSARLPRRNGLIRARRGTPPQTVAAAVDAVGRAVDARDFKSRGLKLYPIGLKPDLVSGARPALLALGVAGVFLVLVLMVNLASVLLARAAQREHEFAVSRALGANGAAVARATLFEGGLLGLAGGVAAALAAIWGTRTLIALAPLDR